MNTKVLQKYKTVNLFGYSVFSDSLDNIDFSEKHVINTINPHSYHVALNDDFFNESLNECDILLPDGIGIVIANKFLNGSSIQKIAGYDLFMHILNRNKSNSIKCFFLGSTDSTLEKISKRLRKEYPNVEFESFSPPFKSFFSEEDNKEMIRRINIFSPDFLFVGMTAPKQEKWTRENLEELNVKVICNIGAVFDFFAGTTKRAPVFLIKFGLEWMHRSFTSTRLLKRTLTSSPLFLHYILVEYMRKLIKPNIENVSKTESKSFHL
ncbi:WecB/TagA/CpsF family glycosyltransferase [Belliella sp. DSM 107340]|uniref:WecB/TagA/CpsF family glycosyltransferase n=1 Tax=Belliella calami TaxID=2923436 RepID=A0ABS9UVB7_9BACT|nr:WecB/TagA/CpsF family glycosyltransferase [Belliella calami]MCH7400193.1 WecB/TagA/CpsF family glycosyltransferase [Belliella calami]